MHISATKIFIFLLSIAYIPLFYPAEQYPRIAIYGKEGIDKTIDIRQNVLMVSKTINMLISDLDTVDHTTKISGGPFSIDIIKRVFDASDHYQNALYGTFNHPEKECRYIHYQLGTSIVKYL